MELQCTQVGPIISSKKDSNFFSYLAADVFRRHAHPRLALAVVAEMDLSCRIPFHTLRAQPDAAPKLQHLHLPDNVSFKISASINLFPLSQYGRDEKSAESVVLRQKRMTFDQSY